MLSGAALLPRDGAELAERGREAAWQIGRQLNASWTA